jgi:hypothetical protein
MPHPHPQEPAVTASAPLEIAILLLAFQQRMAALDRLYNEEIAGLTEGLSRLEAAFVRQYPDLVQVEAPTTLLKRPRRKAGSAKAPHGNRK